MMACRGGLRCASGAAVLLPGRWSGKGCACGGDGERKGL